MTKVGITPTVTNDNRAGLVLWFMDSGRGVSIDIPLDEDGAKVLVENIERQLARARRWADLEKQAKQDQAPETP